MDFENNDIFIANEIDQIIFDCCAELEIENKFLIPSSQWLYILTCINARLIKPNRQQLLLVNNTSVGEYDVNKIDSMINIYIDLCLKYNQAMYLIDFIRFIGINKCSMHNLGSRGLNLEENFKQSCERSHITAAENNPKAQTIHLAYLNKYHDWNGAGTTTHKQESTVLTAAELPKLTDNNT